MYRFLLRPRWIAFHLLVLGAFVLMVNLGFWQLRRLDERQAFNDRVNERIDAPPVALDELVPTDARVGDDVLDEVEWRPTQVRGEYLPDEQFVVVNRSQSGQPGEMVVT
ncbi:MAG: SURF1 family protein, partial [Actinomycetota bacterium]|nr:SURF1 family protein [Actinomycetota bacterium]